MKIIKNLLLCSMLLFCMQAAAQSQSMIAITPYAGAIDGVPEGSLKSLDYRLTQLVTQNGFGSTSGAFVLTCNVLTLNKEAIPTVPVQYSMELEVSLYLVNILEEIIVAECPVTVKALEKNETKAYVQAFNQINPRSPKLRAFMTTCREKITEYYTERLPVLIAKAQTLADQDKFEEALAVLGTIPESVPQYMTVAQLSSKVHTEMLDRDATKAITQAKSAMVKKDYDAALKYVNSVHPASSLAQQAYAMIDKIADTMQQEEKAAREAELKEAEAKREQAERVRLDNLELEKLRIEAAKKTAVAQAKVAAEQQQSESSSLKGIRAWLLGKIGN